MSCIFLVELLVVHTHRVKLLEMPSMVDFGIVITREML